jgi:hypothetical protein
MCPHCRNWHRVCLFCCVQAAAQFAQARQQHLRQIDTAVACGTLPGPHVGHCGRWHPITALPWACPRCGTVVLQEEA